MLPPVTLAQTPGYSGLAQPLPKETTPIKALFESVPSMCVTNGPPESPLKIVSKICLRITKN